MADENTQVNADGLDQVQYVSENPEVMKFLAGLLDAIATRQVIKLFDHLLTIATEDGASDIHIEPFEHRSRIRLRIDGVLIDLVHFQANLHDNVIAKFKIETGQMRPDEKRLPQDARVSTSTLTNKELDLRASTVPTVRGEKLVMRLVDKSKKLPPLEMLGIEGVNNEILNRNIWFPNGVILVTWPTGSGKTTTLYASLAILNNVDVNIITFEDPVEVKVHGLNQAQVRADIWFTFASWLRAALRQDPDIIMVWEIRDFETLNTGMEAAMTGHLVFSTVHTNSAAETITRVMNLGAKPYMITGTFNVIIAQRLARKLRDDCKIQVNVKEKFPELYESAKQALLSMKQDALDREMTSRNINRDALSDFMEKWLAWWPDPAKWQAAFKWRVWLYEMLEFDDEIKQLLLEGEKALAVEKYALQEKWMVNLERDGVFKLMQGKISIEEVYRLVKHKKY
jgi:type II secretory ATPase GspE/PulE/Tfp pilus assembly ATPase PilB-like protein